MLLYKGDETISCDKGQLDIMKKAGWSRSKNPEGKKEAKDGQDNDGQDNDGQDNDGQEDTTPEEDKPAPATKKKKLKKKA